MFKRYIHTASNPVIVTHSKTARLITSHTKPGFILLPLIFFLGGCVSATVQNQSHGQAKVGDVVNAAVVDVATLPILVVALPILAINESQKNKNSAKHVQKDNEVITLRKALADNPDVIMQSNYHTISDIFSVEFIAVSGLIENGIDIRFSEGLYTFIYTNFTQKYHNRLRTSLLANRFIPEDLLLKAYAEFVVNYTEDFRPDGPRMSYIDSILKNRILPENRLTELQQHESEYLRNIAKRQLQRRQQIH